MFRDRWGRSRFRGSAITNLEYVVAFYLFEPISQLFGAPDTANLSLTMDSALVFYCPLRYQSCMAFESIDELARRLADSVPQGLRSVKQDLEKNFRSVLSAGLGKLDLVNREEFEVQEAVLARTRQKLETLEERLQTLEAKKVKTKKKKAKTKKK